MADCFDRSWRVGSKARGTRSQFRLSTGLLPFKCTYPAHFTDVMDAIPSTSSDLRRTEFTSPVRGTRTRTVREYEQTIDELKKENFDLKLRLFLVEDPKHRNNPYKGSYNEVQDKTVEVSVDLNIELETLQNELSSKSQLLQEALDEKAKCESDLKDLQNKCEELQEQLSSFTPHTSEQELKALKDENDNLQKSNELLNAQIEELLSENTSLKKKVEKSSLAIQGIVTKYFKDSEIIPKDLRPIVQSAVLAAKQNKTEDLNAAIENFKTSLSKLMFVNGGTSSESKSDADHGKDSIEELQKLTGISKSSKELSKNSKSKHAHMLEVVKENEHESSDAVEKVKHRDMEFKEEKSKPISSLPMKHSSAQTTIQWYLMQSKLSDKFVQNAGHSNSLEDLKEEILTLLLMIEQKDQEISDCEEKLVSLQQQLEMENEKGNTFANCDKDFLKERDVLHDRLAHSCAVNNELIKHLKNLETFMQELLQHRNLETSSFENSVASTFSSYFKIQHEIEQSLELTNILTEELSICEGSKVFDPNDFTTSQDLSSRYSYQPTDTSRFGVDLSNIPSNIQGRKSSQLHLQETSQNAIGTGKRRMSFSTLHNSSLDATLCDKENVVVLGTSNNEDLILLLNDKGDPEDVLIRNNYSHLERTSAFGDEIQHRRRCWESAAMSYLTAEKSALDHRTEQWCSNQVDGSKVIGGWFNPYPSSDSDIWSEPDRNISLQRIGIDLQKSPVSQKSPRRSRFRDKLSTDDVSSQKNESSSSFSKLHTWSKRRKNSDTSRSSFICKKCMMHSQTSDIPTKEEKRDFQKTIDELSNKCTSQENHLKNLMNDLEVKKNTIDELSNKCSSQENHLKNLMNELEVKKNTIDALAKEERMEIQRTIDELSNKCSSQENHLKNLMNELEVKNNTIDALAKEEQKLLNCINHLKESQKSLVESEANSTDKLAVMNLEYNKLQILLKQFEAKVTDSNAICDQLKSDLEESKNRLQLLEQKCLDYETELAMLSNEKGDSDTLAKENRELLNCINRLKESHTNLVASETSSAEKLNYMNSEYNRLQRLLTHFESRIINSDTICNQLRNDLERSEHQLKFLEQKCLEYEMEQASYANVKAECNALLMEKQEMLNHINHLNESQKSSVENEANTAKKFTEMNSNYNKMQNLLKHMESKIIDSEATCNQLRNELEEREHQLKRLEQKCSDYEKELAMHGKVKADYDALIKEKNELLNYINGLKESQKYDEKEGNATEKLAMMDSEYNRVQLLLKQLETRVTHSDAKCNQLQSDLEKSNFQLKLLEQKCSEYVEEISAHANAKVEYSEKFKLFDEEKTQLIHDIETLVTEKNELLSKIEAEKGCRHCLENENCILNNKLIEGSEDVSLLRSSSKELEDTTNRLLKEKESHEYTLISSNSICNELKNDLKNTREHLEKMELKCALYEEELKKSRKSKQNITHSLLEVKSGISSNIDILASLCKQYLKSNGEIQSNKDTLISDTDKKDKIEIILEEIISKNAKFEEIVKFLSEQLSYIQSTMDRNQIIAAENKSQIIHQKQQLEDKEKEIYSLKMQLADIQQNLEENKAINKECQLQLEYAQKKLQVIEREMETLREHKDQISSQFVEIQQALKEKEKFLADSNFKALETEKHLTYQKEEVQRYQNLMNLKDDEITKLQERVFNLQAQVNNILYKATSPAGLGSSKDIGKDILTTSMKAKSHVISGNETNEETLSTISNDTSFSSITSAKDDEMSRKIDRYSKKIKALQTKLSMTEKRIEILEREKAVLREELLAELHGEKDKSKSFEENVTLLKDIHELKSNLKTKTSFINDLKSELLKTCNSLIDKDKEIDELRRKLSSSNRNTEPGVQSPVHDNIKPSYSDPIQKTTETNIKELKKQKWNLIQGILSHQKQFYEKKNIHLGHFEKFKNHIEKLRSLQMYPSLFKSESEPLLNNPIATNSFYAEKCDKTLRNLQIELQLDVEYLQNLKIFLKRFFMPLALQCCNCNSTSKPGDDSNASGKNALNETKNSSREHLRLDLWKSSSAEVIHPPTISTSDSLIATTSVVVHKIDAIETALKETKIALEHFQETDSPIGETHKKTAAKSILLKMLKNLANFNDNFTELFQLNSALKSLGLFDISIPQSPFKQESDRESLLSEETIALSRSGSLSPMSFDDNFTYSRLFSNSMKHKQEADHLGENAVGMKQNLEVSHRSQTTRGSQESIFLRSHFSSPDLGIESDPNHESSAPEQAEKEVSRLSKRQDKQSDTKYSFTDNSSKIKEASFGMGDMLHAIGHLKEYELLKKEVQESLIGIKTVLSRTGDGLHHLAKFTTPQKNLECSTFKAIRDTCGNIETCLQKAVELVDNFWIAPCPSVEELDMLIQQNYELQDKLKQILESKSRQEMHFKEEIKKLKQAEQLREKMEKKIAKKLIKTKKVIRQAEIKILENKNRDLSPLPKYPCDQSTSQKS